MLSPFGGEWVVAGTPGHPAQAAAILKLVEDDKLPGPVFITLEQGQEESEEGKRLVAASKPLDGEGLRRLVTPQRGRLDFVGDVTPRFIVLAPGEPLWVAPWGGDFASAHTQISLEGHNGRLLMYRELPGDSAKPQNIDSTPLIGGRLPESWQAAMADVKLAIMAVAARNKKVICRRRVGRARFPVCHAIDVRYTPGEGYCLHLALDATVARVFPDR